MCPSFMATRDEEHSTRGRANLLRAALSGRLPEGTMTSQRLYDAPWICAWSARACKAECESGVDMAKLKYEFLDKFYQTNKRPLRAKVFAHLNRVSRLGSKLAFLANWGTQSSLGKMLTVRMLGVHPNRTLPSIASQTFPRWFASRPVPDASKLTKGTVALFNDTFMNYNYPQIGRAAVELLEAAGFRVELVSPQGADSPGGGLLRASHDFQGVPG